MRPPTSVTTTATLDGNAEPMIAVCFSPGGRTYVNTTGSPWSAVNWTVLNTVLDLGVQGEGRTHQVVVLPNGTARLGL
jgi:hypothetical protein